MGRRPDPAPRHRHRAAGGRRHPGSGARARRRGARGERGSRRDAAGGHEGDHVPVTGTRRWIVDGMNVIGSRPDGWWRDRPAAMRALAERLGAYAAETGDEVTVVFDGKPFELEAEGVRVVFASRRLSAPTRTRARSGS